MFVWQAHKGKIRSLAFSPDGGLLATATGSSRFVSLWNPVTGELVRKLEPAPRFTTPRTRPTDVRPPKPIPLDTKSLSVAFASDAPLFANGMSDSVRVWDTATWTERQPLTEKHPHAFEIALGRGPDPRVASGDSSRVYVWESADTSESPVAIPVAHVPCLDFSPDGALLATNVLAQAQLWNPATGALVRAIPHTHSTHHGPVKFSPDGSRLAVGYRKLVSIYPVAGSGDEVVCEGHTKPVWSACWSADGRTLLTASADGTARLWDPTSGAEQRSFEWGIGEIRTVAFSADGLLGAAGAADGKVVVWDVDA